MVTTAVAPEPTVALPKIQVFNRVLELPIIELALVKSASTYSRIKNSYQLVHWVLSTAENSLTIATNQAAPIAKKFQTPIHYVDHTLCLGLDIIQAKLPMVNESPEQVLKIIH